MLNEGLGKLSRGLIFVDESVRQILRNLILAEL